MFYMWAIPHQVVHHSKKNQTNICSSAAVNCKSTTFAVFLVRLRGLKNNKKTFFACVAEMTVKYSTKMLDYS